MTFDEFKEEWFNTGESVSVNTSGSTGSPKTIQLDKEFLRESAARTNSFFHINASSRLHSCVGADFIGGKMMAVRAWESGAKFSWEKPSNSPLNGIGDEETIDLLAVVPSQMLGLLEKKENLPDIKNIIIGGSAIHPELRKKIESRGLNTYETYGMTETASHIALRKVTEKPGPFKTLSGITVKSGNDECLIISFKNGVEVKTNDLVKTLSDTEFFILGRKDDVIITGGKKVNPVNLEEKIAPFMETDFMIAGFPDEKWGEKLVMIIEGNEKDVDLEELEKSMATILERWELPKEIRFTSKLPRTSNGKLIRAIERIS